MNDFLALNAVIAKSLAGLKPPEKLTVSQWADKYRRLSPESSAETGPWRTSRTPYLKEPMDAFTDPHVRHIVMVAASQVGKSEMINNIIGYIIDQDPGSILLVDPTTVDSKEYSKLRIGPMIRDCPRLRRKVADPKARDSGNTILQKSYPGGILTMCGSTEAHALASKPIRYVLGDEIDRWAISAGKEGSPWELAKARQTTFYNAKSFEVSTPTTKNASAIADAFTLGTQERWCVECPHCHQFHDITFANLQYDTQIIQHNRHKVNKVTQVWYVCPECAAFSTEAEMRRQPAKWIPENPAAYQKGTRSFWLNAFSSPWVSWLTIIQQYLDAAGDSFKLQVVYNTCFGELWENRGGLEDSDAFLDRREDYSAELPPGVFVLTCGVDTQDDRLEYEVVGHGFSGESWGIRHGVIMGRPDNPETWALLDDVLTHIYRFANGKGLRVSRTFIDEGGHFTQDVRIFCRERLSKNVFAIKGRGGESVPYTGTPKQQKIVVDGRYFGLCWTYQVGVDSGKQSIMDNLRVKSPGKQYCHFPSNDDAGYDSQYFNGLLSERLEYHKELKNPWRWEKIPGHERNEALDCRNYANAALKSIDPDFDALAKRVRDALADKPRSSASASAHSSASPADKTAPNSPGLERAVKKFYDDW